MALTAHNLRRRFGTRVAVDGISFSVADGEALGVLGPNGAGKSTTFALLTGMLLADSGTISWNGREVSPLDWSYRSRIGVVFQKPSLDEKLTGRENLHLGAALYGVRRADARDKIDRVLSLVELADRADELVQRYSGGMKRRLELARVLLHDPELLVMDEPTSGLDIAASRRIWQKLLELKRESRAAILLTTHDPEEAALCDRILVLDHGKIIAEGTPDALCRRIGGDVVTLETETPEEVQRVLDRELALGTYLNDGKVLFERGSAHELIPRVVALLPGQLKSVSMRPPTLGDVFIQLTGRSLTTSVETTP